MKMNEPALSVELIGEYAAWYPGNYGIDAEVIPLDTVGDLLTSGITRVQNAHGRSGAVVSSGELQEGLDDLCFMGQLLGSDRYRFDAFEVKDEHTSSAGNIVEDALLEIVLSPLDDSDKLPLVDRWVAASSTGHGKICRNAIIAKHRAANTVANYAETFPDVPYFGEFAHTLDKRYGNGRRFAIAAGVAVVGTAVAVKHFLGR